MLRTTIACLAVSTLFLFACENSSNTGRFQQSYAVSDCGGFEAAASRNFKSAAYCDAEVLHWSYDAATQTLNLSDNRILLNCCGEHSMTFDEQQGVYVATERDAPEFGDARCGCMCVFDFSIQANPVPAAQIPLRIVRNVTDDANGPVTVFDDVIDLTAGSGEIVLDQTDVGMWCEGPAL